MPGNSYKGEKSVSKLAKVLPKVTIHGRRENKVIPKRKLEYAAKLKRLLDEYNTCLIVTVDNVGSSQIADLRRKFRGRGRFLFGKNTLVRKVIREYMKETGNRKLMALMELVKGNGGFIFTKGDIEIQKELIKEINNNKVQCSAKAGAIAPVDVYVPIGPTRMEATQTTFFQSMNIATRIVDTQISILERKKVITKGEKVGHSPAILLKKLDIKPFYYGVEVSHVFMDGEVYPAAMLELTEEDIAESFYIGLRHVAALCYSINYPSIINIPHSVLNAYKKMLALGLSCKSYTWNNLELVKDILANPETFANLGDRGKHNENIANTLTTPQPQQNTPQASPSPDIDLFPQSSSEEDDTQEESESEEE